MIVKKNIAIRIAGKVSRYIDASMNRATPSHAQVIALETLFWKMILTYFDITVSTGCCAEIAVNKPVALRNF